MGNGNTGRGKVVLLLLSMSLVVMLMAGFRNEADANPLSGAAVTSTSPDANDQSAVPGTAGIEESLTLLTSVGQKATVSGAPVRLVLKWQGEYSVNYANHPEASVTAVRLGESLGLNKVVSVDENGHKSYRASAGSTDNPRVSLFWSELGAGKSYAIVTVETDDLAHATGFDNIASQVGKQMIQMGVAAEWNAALQGMAQEQGEPGEALLLTEAILSEQAPGLAGAESYEDESTYSRSYTVPGLERFVISGKHRIALQAAVHRDGINNVNRVTIGLPLITIEY
jgi:hypothetical protein